MATLHTTASSMAPWKARIQQSLTQNASLVYAKYMQVATVKLDGRPANRTVVFRGFLGDSDDLTFITDRRSSKVQEVASNPAAEVAWYFPNSREQYRLTGSLAIIEAQHASPDMLKARQAAWDALSEGGRSQFSWPQPGLPRDLDPQAFKQAAPGPQEEPLPNFCLAVLRVTEVDYIQLFDNIRATFLRQEDGSWACNEINP